MTCVCVCKSVCAVRVAFGFLYLKYNSLTEDIKRL